MLEQHFDTAFAAPDGITQLRERILTLAVQGKFDTGFGTGHHRNDLARQAQ
ncbi:MAG: hypothetical protein ACR2HF_15185 [Methylococcaceae bacterium]